MTELKLKGPAVGLPAQYTARFVARNAVAVALGYVAHIGRSGHVASALGSGGAAVYALDHAGHGRSEGERALINDMGGVVEDLHLLVRHARDAHPGRPLVLLGHSMGGLIATRYA